MIRAFQPADLNSVCALWLAANLQAHSFIPSEYWKANQALVRELLPQAEVYVYEKMRDAALDLSHHMGYTEVKLPAGRTHL